MVYCKHEPGKRFEKERATISDDNLTWDDNVRNYIYSEKPWEYCFDEEASKSDCEQSFLSRSVFYLLLNKSGSTQDVSTGEISISVDKKIIYFDLMNNYKHPWKNAEIDIEKWKNCYHCIGNFAPVPGESKYVYETKSGKPVDGQSIQKIHNWLNERWDKLLKYLQNNWNSQGMGWKSFQDYIIGTYQQFYCREVIGNNLENLSSYPEDWTEWIENANSIIKNQNSISILDMEELTAEQVAILINARGYCMLSELRRRKSK